MSNNDQEFLVQKIRTQYTEKQYTELDALKAMDKKVKRPVNVFAYTYGAVSAIIMGAGMSLVMTEIGAMIGLTNTMVPGIIIGIVGTLILGTGMSLCMTDLGAMLGNIAMVLGVVVGFLGLILVALAYPAYNWVLKIQREKIAPEILRLSDELLK
jgi:hypothetical protein